MVDGAPVRVYRPVRSGLGRLPWLRVRLVDLRCSLGRVPTPAELAGFLGRYRVEPIEIDALIDGDLPGPATSPLDVSAAPALFDVLVPPARVGDEAASSPPELGRIQFTDGDVREGPRVLADKVVRRVVDDLVDDWHRAGNTLHYEDITRLVSKRGLSPEQTAAVLAVLHECGVQIEGLATRSLSDTEADEAEHDPSTPVFSDAIRAYLSEISRYQLIWAEDEVRLGRQIQVGLGADAVLADPDRLAALAPQERIALQETSVAGRRAHREMVCANLRLVVSIAKNRSYQSSGVEFLDRVQDGNVGLMRAADKYDPTLGYKFSTYATWWVRQFISRGIADRGSIIRLPVHLNERVQSLHRAQRTLGGRNDREPTLAELSEHIGWNAGTVQALLDWSRPLVSLDMRVGTEGDITLGDLLSDRADVDGRTDPVNCVIEAAGSRDLDAAIDSILDAREQEVIRLRYGLRGMKQETLDVIGEVFGVTRERIRQIEAKAIDKLRTHRSVDHLRIYLVDDLPDQPPPLEIQVRAKFVRLRAKACRTTIAAKRPTTAHVAGVSRHQFLFETVGEVVDAS